MKKIATLRLFFLAAALMVTGCAAQPSAAPAEGRPGGLRAAVVVFGSFGDNGFNDMAKAGLERAFAELGVTGQAFESGGYDITKVEPLLLDLCEEGSYDVLFAMGAACREPAENAAERFPGQKFVIVDAASSKDLPNVASLTFRQNEASFLGGVVAGYATTQGLPRSNPGKTVGVVLLRDNTVINDFFVGYLEGCRYVDPDIKVLSAYNNSAADSAKAKELAINMAGQGADVVFGVCSLATLGVVDGCKAAGVYALGVDNDTAAQVRSSDGEAAGLILTSVLKNTGEAVYRTLQAMAGGGVAWGAAESLGFEENCVGLAENPDLPQDLQALLDQCRADIIAGNIQVGTAMNKSAEEIAALREDAAR